jgi:hypothetical protein
VSVGAVIPDWAFKGDYGETGLRDRFAMHVMSAIIAKHSIPNIDMARKAYQIADAMLEVRNDSKSD